MLFRKSHRLLTKRDFLRPKVWVYRFSGVFFSLDIKSNSLSHPRLGVIVSKKFGDAHKRNYFKRCLREAFRQWPPTGNVDCIVRPKLGLTTYTGHKLFLEWQHALLSMHK